MTKSYQMNGSDAKITVFTQPYNLGTRVNFSLVIGNYSTKFLQLYTEKSHKLPASIYPAFHSPAIIKTIVINRRILLMAFYEN